MIVQKSLQRQKSKLRFRRLQLSTNNSFQQSFQKNKTNSFQTTCKSLRDQKKNQCNSFQTTCRSLRDSKKKFKTINYKFYQDQRKAQLHKRKIMQKPLNLYLKGAKPSNQATDSLFIKKNLLKFEISNLKPESFATVFNSRPQFHSYSRFISAKKQLKNKILKQIKLKSLQIKEQKQISREQNYQNQSEGNYFLNQEISISNSKGQLQKPHNSTKQNIFILSKKRLTPNILTQQITPPRLSVFSQRKFIRRKNPKKLKSHEIQQKSFIFSPFEQKSSSKPIITLESQQSKIIQAESYIVLNYHENKILTGKNYKKNAQIASLTKNMTFYAILCICEEYSIDYSNKFVYIQNQMEQISGTSAYIQAGQKYTLEQLLYGLMLPSGNDAAMALANQGGFILNYHKKKQTNSYEQNVKQFVKYMNIIARKIGMKTSSFSNPHGLPNYQNVSNAYDMSILVSACLKFPQFLKITGTKRISFWIEGLRQKKRVCWQNTNKLLRRQGFVGGKTGVTVTAGPCLTTVYKSKDGQILIIVLLKARKLSRRFKQTRWILGLTLKKLCEKKYKEQLQLLMKENPQIDSDQSQDQQSFDFNRSDSQQMRKRVNILINQM